MVINRASNCQLNCNIKSEGMNYLRQNKKVVMDGAVAFD